MVCSISMTVAALIGAGVLTPDLIDGLSDKFKAVVGDGAKLVDTEAVVQWNGTISLRERRGEPVPVEVFLYKAQKRLRIHLLADDIAREDADRITDQIADAFEAEIVSRGYATPPQGDAQDTWIEPAKPTLSASPTALRRTR